MSGNLVAVGIGVCRLFSFFFDCFGGSGSEFLTIDRRVTGEMGA